MAPSIELVERVRDLYHKRVSDVRFLIPVLAGLTKVTMATKTVTIATCHSRTVTLLLWQPSDALNFALAERNYHSVAETDKTQPDCCQRSFQPVTRYSW